MKVLPVIVVVERNYSRRAAKPIARGNVKKCPRRGWLRSVALGGVDAR